MRANLVFGLGIVMVLLGAYVALHPLWAPRRPITGSIWLDGAFALVFLVRGLMNLRAARRSRTSTPAERGH